jgi:hypothetical protein
MELFLEATIDSLSLNAVSGLTQKHLDKRYQNDFNIDLAQAAYYRKQDFLEMIFFANSTYGATGFIAATNLPQGKNGQYTLCIRWYNVKQYLKDEKNMGYSQLEQALKQVVHNCDAKFYSDDPSFYWQGVWEGLDKNGMSIYKFTGEKGKGVWEFRIKNSACNGSSCHCRQDFSSAVSNEKPSELNCPV